jgi:undecaprenyl-diphosphatase
VPGISRSGASITAGRFAGLDREPAARFAFLMATPITLGAVLFEARELLAGEGGFDVQILPLMVGMVAALVSGLVAIRFMLDFLRRQSLDVFVAYRFVLAAIVLVVWLGR